jgi:hypothetical protein
MKRSHTKKPLAIPSKGASGFNFFHDENSPAQRANPLQGI